MKYTINRKKLFEIISDLTDDLTVAKGKLPNIRAARTALMFLHDCLERVKECDCDCHTLNALKYDNPSGKKCDCCLESEEVCQTPTGDMEITVRNKSGKEKPKYKKIVELQRITIDKLRKALEDIIDYPVEKDEEDMIPMDTCYRITRAKKALEDE